MELLAPAGDWDALIAALAGGADAVYLGSKAFSARQYASNFDLERLKLATDLLHLHRKKIYVTVNTLISDTEMPEAINLLGQIYNIGVDAVIIQDLGLINLARKYLPELELHASTQMTVHNLAGALFLKKLGIKRIVLARELTKEEVGAIKRGAGMEVEVFIHGALCVCYSGQCLMSSMIGGRSGNRGRCAQPCRLEYRLFRGKEEIKTKGNFLLSPKDLALAELIPDLERAGVSALKIEGRMKRPEYVYTVVKTYRRLLNRFAESPDQYRIEPVEIRKLSETFNRGFTTGYFGGNRNREIISVSRPNNRGVFIGRIIKV
ncbi:MAG: peptidase U32 family protein, partial [Bacteroidota bacterium]